MPELTLHHIDQISSDVRKQEITVSHLLDELIDHLCCDVENEMQKGLSFAEAYRNVKKKMGPRRLKEIQEETLYVVDNKYRKMKNTMKISGIAGTIMLGFAAIFKIQHWPGAGILMNLGAITLALVFMPSALGVLWKETHSGKRLFLFISAFLAGVGFIAGTLFKIQHWPGAGKIMMFGALAGIFFFIPSLLVNRLADQDNKHKQPVYILGAFGFIFFFAGMLFKIQHWNLSTLFMVTGLILMSLVAFPWYTWLTWKEESHISSKFIYMVVGFLLIVIPGAMVNLNMQHSYQDLYYPNNYQQNAMYNYLYKNNNSILISYQDSSDYLKLNQMHEKTTEMLTIIGNIQEKMVQESEGEQGKPAVSASQISHTETGIEILYYELSKPFDLEPVKDFLSAGSASRQKLNSSMAEYESFLTTMVPADDLSKYKEMLDTETYLPMGNNENNPMSLMSGLHSLEIMKNGLLTVESCILQDIVRH
jgi:hypothetical protein